MKWIIEEIREEIKDEGFVPVLVTGIIAIVFAVISVVAGYIILAMDGPGAWYIFLGLTLLMSGTYLQFSDPRKNEWAIPPLIFSIITTCLFFGASIAVLVQLIW